MTINIAPYVSLNDPTAAVEKSNKRQGGHPCNANKTTVAATRMADIRIGLVIANEVAPNRVPYGVVIPCIDNSQFTCHCVVVFSFGVNRLSNCDIGNI
jgi:hypothetical protein